MKAMGYMKTWRVIHATDQHGGYQGKIDCRDIIEAQHVGIAYARSGWSVRLQEIVITETVVQEKIIEAPG